MPDQFDWVCGNAITTGENSPPNVIEPHTAPVIYPSSLIPDRYRLIAGGLLYFRRKEHVFADVA